MESVTLDEVKRRLTALGLELPASLPPPAGAYEPYRMLDGHGTLSAQVPGYGPEAPVGQVGSDLTVGSGSARGCPGGRQRDRPPRRGP